MRTDDPKLSRLKIGKRLNRLARFFESAVRGLRLLRIFNSGARGGYILELAWRVENDQLEAWDEAYPVIDSACDTSLPKASQPLDWFKIGDQTREYSSLLNYRGFLERQAEHAKMQHEDRAQGAFGPDRNTPEQINLWKGIESGFRQALEELDLRNTL